MNLNREIVIRHQKFQKLNEHTEKLQEDLEQLLQQGTRCTASLSGMPSGGGTEDKVGNHVVKTDELEGEIESSLKEIQRQRRELDDSICEISDMRLQDIVWLRYIDNLGFRQIAALTGMPPTTVFRKYKNFLKSIDNGTEINYNGNDLK